LVRILGAHRVPVTFQEIPSPWGHDSFLLVVPDYHRTVDTFMRRVHQEMVNGARTAPAPGEDVAA
jgi:homoserine O-acetyltransferase